VHRRLREPWHGNERLKVGDVKEAEDVLASLKDLGINVDHVCQELLKDGVVAFEDAFEALLTSIEKKAAELCTT